MFNSFLVRAKKASGKAELLTHAIDRWRAFQLVLAD
jgi:hypothetical protein